MKKHNLSEDFNPSLDKSLMTKSFLEYRKNGKISFKYIFLLFLKALFLDIPISIINNYPGIAGYKIRQFFYKFFLKEAGKNFILGEGIKIRFPKNFYYFAMVINLFLRFFWLISIFSYPYEKD